VKLLVARAPATSFTYYVKLSRGGARRGTGNRFVSFDLDVLDAAHAPGVSAPNPAGWSTREAERAVLACGADARVRCFDLMELCPTHDEGDRTARVAAHLFLAFLAGFAARRPGSAGVPPA